MAQIIDLSVFQKEDLVIKSLTGEEYHIPGNFSTEFYLYLYNAFTKIQKQKQEDYTEALNLLKSVALEIIKLDKSKNVSMDTIKEQFDDFNVLQALIGQTMQYANEVVSDPTTGSPTSK
ncbi:MAG: hypothetical protein VB078_10785 [Clostridiaceae bacterium]|nr:hypothetical protein [Clostridiaceae bacterium]